MRASFTGREQIADHIFSFYFKPEKPIHYIAGQFIELYLPHEEPDNRGIKRWFTLSSSPHEELLSITTRFAAEKGSSFKSILNGLRPGDEVKIVPPMGDFVLPKDKSIPLIFVAGGIGCTPFHSIIRDLELTDENRQINLLYSANKLEDVAFKSYFEQQLGKDFQIVLTDPAPGWEGESGRLDAQRIIEITKPSPAHYVYISGPEPMIESFYGGLIENNINKRQIYTDYFPNYQPL